MTVDTYFASYAKELKRQAERVAIDFKTHRPSSGEVRESMVGNFLRDHLPKAFGVGTGIILSTSGDVSNEADLVIVDDLYNTPLHAGGPAQIWLVESVYAMIEVKTQATPSELEDAFKKCRRFKLLPRRFDNVPESPRIKESLFVLWAFNGPEPWLLKSNIDERLRDIPSAERPDVIVVPDRCLALAGQALEAFQIGHPGTARREEMLRPVDGDIERLHLQPLFCVDTKANAMLMFMGLLTAWLKAAGRRSTNLNWYVPESFPYGTYV